MEDRPKEKGWWQTVPGILTAAAGIITAVTGLIVALNQAGVFDRGERKAPPPPTSAERPQPKAEAPPPPPTKGSSETLPPPSAPPSAPAPSPGGPAATARVNLLASENGGHLVLASSEDWQATIDGREDFAQISYGLGKEAVYTFKDERPVTFDTFAMLIPGTENNNIKEFELLVGDGSPTGPFRSVGTFQTQNVRIFKNPYQEFKFSAVTAKYVKFKLISTHGGAHPGVYEFQLWGKPDGK